MPHMLNALNVSIEHQDLIAIALCPGSTCNSTVVKVGLHLQRNRR